MRTWTSSAALVVVLAGYVLQAGAQPPSQAARAPLQFGEWRVVPLAFIPVAINDRGVIVGTQNNRAVRYQSGILTTLPLPSALPAGASYAALDLTKSGIILGASGDSPNTRAFYWSPTTHLLPPAPHDFAAGYTPVVINNSRVIIGNALEGAAVAKWTPTGGYTLLQPPPDFTELTGTVATDINDAGYTVGYVRRGWDGFERRYAVLWAPSGSPTLVSGGRFEVSGKPHIRYNGDIAADYRGTVSIASADGSIHAIPAVPYTLSLDGFSDVGRLIGTASLTGGATKGWTFFNDRLTYLEPPAAGPRDYVHPTGVNSCGSIVGEVVHSTGDPTGILFGKDGAVRCDLPPVVKQ